MCERCIVYGPGSNPGYPEAINAKALVERMEKLMPEVRAKFRCMESTRKYVSTRGGVDYFEYQIRLLPVMEKVKGGGYDPTEENKKFFAATPSGEITLNVVAESAGKSFVPGQAYYVDFTPADG